MKDELREFYRSKENEKKTALDCWNEIHSTMTPKEKITSGERNSRSNGRCKRQEAGGGHSIWKRFGSSIKIKTIVHLACQ
jgi:hypothetical protein